ncbi:MAG: cupin domain-containing protein [Verrucomicrobia bacterium]|nr:cupin domain-containing protein [Verrucomicrobiota bacterium]
MRGHRINFSSLAWESLMEGVREKAFTDGVKKLRLVEYAPAMPPHWCEKGHFGYILEGRFEIEFADVTYVFEQGDGVFIPSGAEHKHRARALSDIVRVVFVEDA